MQICLQYAKTANLLFTCGRSIQVIFNLFTIKTGLSLS
ncbi:hypothetical protein PALB_22340 [Pseudoalteromonas luteoviolacea B = ATCC 29581]|nr:hypothetical protein PALB_22340 [Pseudoalteromonas luteoviolacea B = ATCC 29581]